MNILVGIPMYNGALRVCRVIESIQVAVQNLSEFLEISVNAKYMVVDDHSSVGELQILRGCQESNTADCTIVSLAEEFPHLGSNPNLGFILNFCLSQVALDTDFYLNVESDVFLQPDTLIKLISECNTHSAPLACPTQSDASGENADFVFWGMGHIPWAHVPHELQTVCRPRWCNLGCLLVRGDVARDVRMRCDDQQFKLFCVDQDYTSTVAQKYGRPVFVPSARVVHMGRQSTREFEPGGYGHLAQSAVARIHAKWGNYAQGSLLQ